MSSKTAYYICLIFCNIFTVAWHEAHGLHWKTWIISTTILNLSAEFGEISPLFLSKIFTRRTSVAWSILFTSFISTGILNSLYSNAPDIPYSLNERIFLIIQFAVQGALVGVIMRMLLLNLFAQMIRSGDTFVAKILIFLAWVVFFIMFPLGKQHINFSPAYILGCGSGFFIHYYVRSKERKRTLLNKFKKIILEKSSSQSLTSDETESINLYVKRKWPKLAKQLSNGSITELQSIIFLCMLRIQRQYNKSLNLIKDKIQEGNSNNLQILFIHAAINEGEKYYKFEDDRERKAVFNYLDEAYSRNNDCLLSNVFLALKTASKYEQIGEEDKNKSLSLIWKAIELSERGEEENLESLLSGMTIPVTYTYLLSSYAYILFKNGQFRLARELLYQCLFQDPSSSATYLYLAELYNSFYQLKDAEKTIKFEKWKKTVKLCLSIAMTLEKPQNVTQEKSFIFSRAEFLLKRIKGTKPQVS